ncbi:hypothetical protein QBB34_29995 [Streptomyces stelliscabiei]|uniref:hypothetical protein n=1 Tax=Streptomyces stelliscabiei TaxID=146820 RepID=UPI002FF37AB4
MHLVDHEQPEVPDEQLGQFAVTDLRVRYVQQEARVSSPPPLPKTTSASNRIRHCPPVPLRSPSPRRTALPPWSSLCSLMTRSSLQYDFTTSKIY